MTVHCWEDHRDDEGNGSSCLLPDRHDGPHAFTPDCEITVRFEDVDVSCPICEGGTGPECGWHFA